MFTIDLAHELEGSGIIVNCLHPATYMDTTMVRQAGVTPWSTVEQGAEAILNLATSPAIEGKCGRYFDGLRESRANEQAYDSKARQQLRQISLELTGLAEPERWTRASKGHGSINAGPTRNRAGAPSVDASVAMLRAPTGLRQKIGQLANGPDTLEEKDGRCDDHAELQHGCPRPDGK